MRKKQRATENNQQKLSDANANIEKADLKGQASLSKILKNRNLMVLIGGIFILFGGLLFFSLMDQDLSDDAEAPLFTIDTKEFYQVDVQNYIDEARALGISDEDSLEGIEQAYTFIVLAEKYDIEVTDDEVTQVLLDLSGLGPDDINLTSDWLNLIGRRAAIEQKAGQELNRATKGYSFVFYFGTLVDPFVNPDDASMESIGIEESWIGDEDRIAIDRQYAREKAEEYRYLLAGGDAEPEDIVNEIFNDERLHIFYRVNEEYQGTGRFGEEPIDLIEQVPGSVAQEIRDFDGDTGSPTEIKSGEVRYGGITEAEADTYEAYYYFILVTDRDERWFEFKKELQEYGLEIYL